jgi:hypothetical protein
MDHDLHTSQKNSLPRRPQNQDIHDTSSELLIVDSLLFSSSSSTDETDVVDDLEDLSFFLEWGCCDLMDDWWGCCCCVWCCCAWCTLVSGSARFDDFAAWLRTSSLLFRMMLFLVLNFSNAEKSESSKSLLFEGFIFKMDPKFNI